MNDNDSSNKGGYKVAGAVVSIAIIVIALFIFGISNIKITKKPTVTNTATQTGVSQAQVATDTPVLQSSSVESTPASSNNTSDISMAKITNEGKLDYSASELETTGLVKDKACYLQDNQVIYLITIQIGAGAGNTDVMYYCPYNTYSSVNVDDVLTVKYKQLTESAFAIMSVEK